SVLPTGASTHEEALLAEREELRVGLGKGAPRGGAPRGRNASIARTAQRHGLLVPQPAKKRQPQVRGIERFATQS
ncbi:MAG TPA: hypothetical protein VMK12_28385, partial [Anaeromyxobacteraceae bacterium]|nr:hypothetical protein [Anaeromyxobacteraceae bacterium]